MYESKLSCLLVFSSFKTEYFTASFSASFSDCIIHQPGLDIAPQFNGEHWTRTQRRVAPSKDKVAQLVDMRSARPYLCHPCFRGRWARRGVM